MLYNVSLHHYISITIIIIIVVCIIIIIITIIIVLYYSIGAVRCSRRGCVSSRRPARAGPALASGQVFPVSSKETLLWREPSPCNPSAETAMQHLMLCSGNIHSYMGSLPELFTDTGSAL